EQVVYTDHVYLPRLVEWMLADGMLGTGMLGTDREEAGCSSSRRWITTRLQQYSRRQFCDDEDGRWRRGWRPAGGECDGGADVEGGV
ncbi:unnamed protein product, partial [Urochloa humidicola]